MTIAKERQCHASFLLLKPQASTTEHYFVKIFHLHTYFLQVNRCLLELAYKMAHAEKETVQSANTTQSYSVQNESQQCNDPLVGNASASLTSGLTGINHRKGMSTSIACDRLGSIEKAQTEPDQKGCTQPKQIEALLVLDKAMALGMYEQDLEDYEAAHNSLEQQQLGLIEDIQANLHAQQAELNNNAALKPGPGRFPARLHNAQLQQDYMMQDQVQTLKVQQQQQHQNLKQQQARLATLLHTQQQLQQRQDEARAERYRKRQQVRSRMKLHPDHTLHNACYTPSRQGTVGGDLCACQHAPKVVFSMLQQPEFWVDNPTSQAISYGQGTNT